MSGKHNEDYFGMFAWKLDDQRNFYLGVVADGVGGQSAGEVASRLTVGAIQNYFDQQAQVENNVSAHLGQAIQTANETVHKASLEKPERRGMSTTVAVAAFVNNRLYTAHVGDSRIYLLRDGRLRQISIDHTWAQEAIEAGLLTPEQAKTHPNRNVIRRHLGGQPNVQVDHRLAIEPGQSGQEAVGNQGLALKSSDTILICSDGLTDMISDGALHESLQNHFSDLPSAAQELIDKANRAGGRDNITLIIMQVPGEVPPMVVAPVGGAVAAAAGTTAQPVAVPAAAATPVEQKGGRGAAWLIIGGVVILLLLALVAGLVIVVSSSLGGDATPIVPEPQMTVPPGVTLPAGAPATAAILATAGALGTPGLDGSGLEEPDLIPTLRSTLTATPRSIGPLVTDTATPTPTSAPAGGGSSPTSTPRRSNTTSPATSTSQATNVPPTATRTPTNTPALPTATNTLGPTNTPDPPTNTPDPPTNTPDPPTNTPDPPTNTPDPPTNTPDPPTNTPDLPTNTPMPPTDTPESTAATSKQLPRDDAGGAQHGREAGPEPGAVHAS
jgi:protein phosphatase